MSMRGGRKRGSTESSGGCLSRARSSRVPVPEWQESSRISRAAPFGGPEKTLCRSSSTGFIDFQVGNTSLNGIDNPERLTSFFLLGPMAY